MAKKTESIQFTNVLKLTTAFFKVKSQQSLQLISYQKTISLRLETDCSVFSCGFCARAGSLTSSLSSFYELYGMVYWSHDTGLSELSCPPDPGLKLYNFVWHRWHLKTSPSKMCQSLKKLQDYLTNSLLWVRFRVQYRIPKVVKDLKQSLKPLRCI